MVPSKGSAVKRQCTFREELDARGVTVTEVAEWSGVSRPYVFRIASGQSADGVSMRILKKLAKALEKKPSYVMACLQASAAEWAKKQKKSRR